MKLLAPDLDSSARFQLFMNKAVFNGPIQGSSTDRWQFLQVAQNDECHVKGSFNQQSVMSLEPQKEW
jgi:hypothetical protein